MMQQKKERQEEVMAQRDGNQSLTLLVNKVVQLPFSWRRRWDHDQASRATLW
jgi:hypothetical protein